MEKSRFKLIIAVFIIAILGYISFSGTLMMYCFFSLFVRFRRLNVFRLGCLMESYFGFDFDWKSTLQFLILFTEMVFVLKSIWLWIFSSLWPSMSYETQTPSNNSNQSTQFQVLGVGLSRTGTFSTRIALTKLLGGKCYHGYVASLDGESEFWQKVITGYFVDHFTE